MSSHNNRRVRAQRKRHAKTILRLRDRIRTLTEQGRMKEAKKVVELTAEHVWQNRKPEPIAAPVAPYVLKHTYHHKIGTPLGLTPTPPVLEKQEPKVHGVNVQRETRSRPKVGGAGRKNGP
jgi:hypothetical protein